MAMMVAVVAASCELARDCMNGIKVVRNHRESQHHVTRGKT